MEAPELKVRPFQRVVERGMSRPVTTLAGSLQQGRFVLTVGGQDYFLPTAAAGSDESGPYACLQEGDWDLDAGCLLRIEPEFPTEDEIEVGIEQSGTHVSLYWPSRHTEALKRQAEETLGTGVNLLIPPEDALSVYFNWTGQVDGLGWSPKNTGASSTPPS
jgi:hypothetical protein